MTPRDWFVGFRPDLRSPRAQSVQVLNAAHALAARGNRVTLCAEGEGTREAALAAFGLLPVPGLRLSLRSGRTMASLGQRMRFAAFVARTRGQGVLITRHWRYAVLARKVFGRSFRLLLEVHEVPSATLHEQGHDAKSALALERLALAGADGVIANAPGTLAVLAEAHGSLPPAVVVHNAAQPAVQSPCSGTGVGIVGSVRPYKDPMTVALAAARVPFSVTWVGALHDPGLLAASEGRLRCLPAVAHREVPAVLRQFSVLLLPLSDGLFGQRLTSPLKLWDALMSGVPLVAADTDAVRAAAPGAALPYTPGDANSLAQALLRAHGDGPLRASLVAKAGLLSRTWHERAGEIGAFADQVLR